jgi:hypothetical protein
MRPALALLFLVSGASAGTVLIDDFSLGLNLSATQGNNGSSTQALPNGADRSTLLQALAGGTASLSIGSGTLATGNTTNPDSGGMYYTHSVSLIYQFYPGLNLLSDGLPASSTHLLLHIASASEANTNVIIRFDNLNAALVKFHYFSVDPNSSALYSFNLASLDASFPWNEVDVFGIEYTSIAAITIGGDGAGLRAVSAVPEPSTYGLALAGLALAAAVRGRRRK